MLFVGFFILFFASSFSRCLSFSPTPPLSLVSCVSTPTLVAIDVKHFIFPSRFFFIFLFFVFSFFFFCPAKVRILSKQCDRNNQHNIRAEPAAQLTNWIFRKLNGADLGVLPPLLPPSLHHATPYSNGTAVCHFNILVFRCYLYVHAK